MKLRARRRHRAWTLLLVTVISWIDPPPSSQSIGSTPMRDYSFYCRFQQRSSRSSRRPSNWQQQSDGWDYELKAPDRF